AGFARPRRGPATAPRGGDGPAGRPGGPSRDGYAAVGRGYATVQPNRCVCRTLGELLGATPGVSGVHDRRGETHGLPGWGVDSFLRPPGVHRAARARALLVRQAGQ